MLLQRTLISKCGDLHWLLRPLARDSSDGLSLPGKLCYALLGWRSKAKLSGGPPTVLYFWVVTFASSEGSGGQVADSVYYTHDHIVTKLFSRLHLNCPPPAYPSGKVCSPCEAYQKREAAARRYWEGGSPSLLALS